MAFRQLDETIDDFIGLFETSQVDRGSETGWFHALGLQLFGCDDLTKNTGLHSGIEPGSCKICNSTQIFDSRAPARVF